MEARTSVVETSLSRARERTARRVFLGCVLYTAALTAVWLLLVLRGDSSFGSYSLDAETIARVGVGLAVFILWGWIWYRIKGMLLRRFAGFSDLERREAFGSRMRGHYDLPALLVRHSERRIRIVEMIGRRGRFILLQSAGFYYLYARILDEPSPRFLTLALQDNLFDAIAFSWVALALYRSDGFLGRMFYGAQSRVMDGSLARANCLAHRQFDHGSVANPSFGRCLRERSQARRPSGRGSWRASCGTALHNERAERRTFPWAWRGGHALGASGGAWWRSYWRSAAVR